MLGCELNDGEFVTMKMALRLSRMLSRVEIGISKVHAIAYLMSGWDTNLPETITFVLGGSDSSHPLYLNNDARYRVQRNCGNPETLGSDVDLT